MVHDLWTNEAEEKDDDKTVEINEEKVPVKAEVPDTDVQSLKLDHQGIERFSIEAVSWKGAGDGTDYEKAVKEEPARTPSGFIPRYYGSESRRPDRTGFGWGWSHSRDVESFPGQQPIGAVASPKVASGFSSDKTDAYRSLYGVGEKSMGTVAPQQESATAAGQATGSQGGLQRNSLSNLPYIALSNTVAHVVKSLPQFFSESATVKKARLFWNAFEVNTEGLPDQSRLLILVKSLKVEKQNAGGAI
ncbi:hypothetical protein PHMEG_0007459 [Phytophthora megakarya]|uniref:Uncharacterized protein n=1 Tax=Phytophthora megakarya TaxID=4795 RepID=A0A225WME2_9STRA|nr:hypothetical protein PHMEG_0007459 [Phytophthora megakarya]